MKTVTILFLVFLISCDQNSTRITQYEDGNLRSKSTVDGDTLVVSYYHNLEGDEIKKAEFKIIDDAVQQASYYDKRGQVILKSTLTTKSLEETTNTSGLYVSLREKSHDYLSLKVKKPYFDEDFPQFFEDMLQSDGKGVLLNDTLLNNSVSDLLVFEYNIMMLNDSMGRLSGTHAYVSINH